MEPEKVKEKLNYWSILIAKGLTFATITIITMIVAYVANKILSLFGDDPILDLMFILICFVDCIVAGESFKAVIDWQQTKN